MKNVLFIGNFSFPFVNAQGKECTPMEDSKRIRL